MVFVALVATMAVIAALRPRPSPWQAPEAHVIDMTPWRGAPWVGGLLIIFVILIYIAFAG